MILARAQFGFTVAIHIMFPVSSIGLASFLAVREAGWLITRKPVLLFGVTRVGPGLHFVASALVPLVCSSPPAASWQPIPEC